MFPGVVEGVMEDMLLSVMMEGVMFTLGVEDVAFSFTIKGVIFSEGAMLSNSKLVFSEDVMFPKSDMLIVKHAFSRSFEIAHVSIASSSHDTVVGEKAESDADTDARCIELTQWPRRYGKQFKQLLFAFLHEQFLQLPLPLHRQHTGGIWSYVVSAGYFPERAHTRTHT